MCSSDLSVEVPPSPKLQSQLVGPPLERSTNATESGAGPERGVASKSATGVTAGPVQTWSCAGLVPSRLE